MIDVHCHLNLHAFDEDFDEVAKRAFESGVKVIVNTGTSIPSSRKAVELAHQYENMYAIVGVHPHHADKTDIEFEGEISENWLEDIEKIARDPKVIGVGEIGLDYYSYKSNGVVDKKIQREAFIAQIQLAHKLGLPLQIHNRHAGEDVVAVLKEYKHLLRDVPGMFHCFASTKEVLKEILDMGFYVGFDGNITYKGLAPGESTSLSELARLTPINRILIETDSPFLTPVPLRGERNEPKNVIIIGEFIAQLKNIPYSSVEQAIYSNFEAVFGVKV
jgi:TatD DNase family protein